MVRDTPCVLSFDITQMVIHNLLSDETKSVNFDIRQGGLGFLRPYMISAKDGSEYFISNFGIGSLRNDSAVIVLRIDTSLFFTGDEITAIAFQKNNLWVGTKKGQISVFKDFYKQGLKEVKHYSIAPNVISRIYSDTEGGVWICTLAGGLYYLPASQSYATHIRDPSITAIRHSGVGEMFCTGTYDGKLTIRDHDKIVNQLKYNFQFTLRIKMIRWINQDSLLIGMDSYIFSQSLRTGKQKNFHSGIFFTEGFKDMDQDETGLWVSSRETIFLQQGKNQEVIFDERRQNSEKLTSLAAGGKTGCWFSTIRALYRLDRKSHTTQLVADETLFRSNLKAIRFIKGHLWVATDGNGIFVLKDNLPIAHFTSENSKLTDNICNRILYDGNDRVWIATNNGISSFGATSRNFLIALSTTDNLINTEVKDLDVRNNKVYAATPDGVSIIDLGKFVSATRPPKVYFKKFTTGGKQLPVSGPLAFVYFKGIVKINFAAITFQVHEKVKYRYKINDRDTVWNETQLDELEFYDLSPGSYVLSLSAKKYNSEWSHPVTLNFSVLPLWYQTNWFLLIFLGLILLLIIFIARSVIRSNKRKGDTQRRALESELKAIRLYMNPHFIFNSLSSLQVFVLRNQWKESGIYISKFARLIRRTMSYSERQMIRLDEEIEFLRTYIELEQTRFENSFSLELFVEKGIDPACVLLPPLVLQPIVENAIKYGLSGKISYGILKISFTQKNNLILVVVEDNGPGRSKVMQDQNLYPGKNASTGIKYTEERLRLLLKKEKVTAPLTIEDLTQNGVPSGTRVTLIIPVLYE